MKYLLAVPIINNITGSLTQRVDRLGLPKLIALGVATTHITVLFRGDHVGDGIAATLVWMAGAVLVSDLQEQRSHLPAAELTGWQAWPAIAALIWCLLVLTFAARFYDPLLFLIPVVCFVGICLLEGATPLSRTMRDLVLIGCLFPFYHALTLSMPIQWIVPITVQLSCIGLWGLGKECVADGRMLELTNGALLVDPPCAGVETLCLSLTSSLVFLVLFPIRRLWYSVIFLCLGSMVLAFVLNSIRIVVLALSSKACDDHWWTLYCGFDFWHVGAGSHLFSLLAVSGVCWLWWKDINRERNQPFDSERP